MRQHGGRLRRVEESNSPSEARARGISASGVAALMATNYAPATIAADRGQKSFRLSLDQFLAKRGGSSIVARGRALKQSNAALFASIEQRFGVPPGPLLAIWGMETAFGTAARESAHPVRRGDPGLRLPPLGLFHRPALCGNADPDRSRHLSASARGSMHGEIGQTQFMPKSILNYGTGQSRYRRRRSDLDSELPQGPWLARGRRISARRSRTSGQSRPGMPLRSISGPSR